MSNDYASVHLDGEDEFYRWRAQEDAAAVRRFIDSIDRDALAVKIAQARYPDGWWPTNSGAPDSAVVAAAASLAYLTSLAPDSKAGEGHGE